MQNNINHGDEVLLTAAHVRRRLGGISDMTLWRWLHDQALEFPQPTIIQKRRYWSELELNRWQANQPTRISEKSAITNCEHAQEAA